MHSHRPSIRALALLVVGAAALPLAGCSAGRSNPGFGADETQTVTVNHQVGAPPVISAAPTGGAAAATAPVTARDTASDKDVAKRLEKAQKRAKHADRALRHERRRAAAARKRAAAREHKLRHQLESVHVKGTHVNHRATRPQRPAPIHGSDVTTVDPDVAAARSQVTTFHRLLNQHDPAACDFLTTRLLNAYYGPDPDQAPARCRATVQDLHGHVGVRIESVQAHDGVVRVRAVSLMDKTARRQTLVLTLVGGQWLIDAVQPAAA
jgi:hypothetical protein